MAKNTKKKVTIDKKTQIENTRKFLLAAMCLAVFIIFFSLHYSAIGTIPGFVPWLLMVLFVLTAYVRLRYNNKHYMITKLGRTKPLAFIVKMIPVAALLAYLFLPRETGLNGIFAGLLAAFYFYVEDTLTVYYFPDEYRKEINKLRKKTRG